ncbi:MAG: methyltransferase domain-containing protein [Solirubrobacterales bacterium]|nr:methyltransferase domain-containing protein [Solirubrobacterales bacterium]
MLARIPSLPAGWSLARANATRLPFQAAGFDVVLASYLLHLLDRPALRRAVGEMRRVTKPGGRVVTVTPVAPRSCLGWPYQLTVAALAQLSDNSLGLRGMDPRQELVRHGLEPIKARYVHRGYPSLCVLARANAA